MTTRKLIHMFVGVPDEMLRIIGMIAVLSARLDFIRIQLLEEADQVPLTTSAYWDRQKVRDALELAFSEPPFAPIYQQVSTWLETGDSLFGFRDDLMHSVGGYEVRGDGAARFVREQPRTPRVKQPQKTAVKLDPVVMALAEKASAFAWTRSSWSSTDQTNTRNTSTARTFTLSY